MLKKLNTFINARTKKVFYIEVFIALVLLSMPSWFFWASSLPKVETIQTKWFSIDSFGFNNIVDFAFFSLLKLCPVIIIFFWYYACNYWWRHALLVPLIFAIAQFIHILISENSFDDLEFIVAILFSFPIIAVMIFISVKLKFYDSNTILINEVKKEISELLSSFGSEKKLEGINLEFTKLKAQKLTLLDENYLAELIVLRNKIMMNTQKVK